jgi:glycosyltransferase involved in cell wall biosynthesis
MIRVSAIIPTYNRVSELLAAIASIREEVAEVEVIVVDDGSTDGTQDAIRSIRRGVRYIRLQHTGLPAVARNAGIRHSSGDYIALLDSDDEWLPGKIQRQLEVLESDPAVGLACSNALVDGDRERLYLGRAVAASGRLFSDLTEENFVIASTAVLRRPLLDVVGTFCESPALRAVEDYDLWLRLAAITGVHYDAEPLAVYRDAPGEGIRSEQSPIASLRSLVLVLDRAIRFAATRDAVPEHDLKRARVVLRRRRKKLTQLLWHEGRRMAAVGSVALPLRGPELWGADGPAWEPGPRRAGRR